VERIHAAEPRRRAGFPDDAPATQHPGAVARYELDPAQTIDFPAMTDVKAAETAALTRAMREAEYCKVTAGTDYRAAVEHLAEALAGKPSGQQASPRRPFPRRDDS
jgi:hypothetical protein